MRSYASRATEAPPILRFTQAQELVGGVRDADAVCTDVWASMGQESETDTRKQIFAPFQANEALMAHAGSGVRGRGTESMAWTNRLSRSEHTF